jgi:hypothetical protein
MLLGLPIWVPRNGTSNPEDPYYPKPSPVSEFLLWHIEFLFSFLLFRVLFGQFFHLLHNPKRNGGPPPPPLPPARHPAVSLWSPPHTSPATHVASCALPGTRTACLRCASTSRGAIFACRFVNSQNALHSIHTHYLSESIAIACTKQCGNPPTPPQKNTFFCSRSCSFWSLVWVGDSHHSLLLLLLLLLLTHDTRTVFP